MRFGRNWVPERRGPSRRTHARTQKYRRAMSAEPTPMSAHSSPTKKCRVDSACVPTTPPSLTKSSRENESPANAAPGENSPSAADVDDPAEKEPRISDGSSDDNARVSESSGGDEPLDVAAVAEEANHTQVAEEEEVRPVALTFAFSPFVPVTRD